MRNNYFDIDAILAEEELIPTTTLFDFSYLSHLDPDHIPDSQQSKTRNKNNSNSNQHVLSQATKVKLPMWAVRKWANLGYVRMALPRHYGRRFRERLEADPPQVDLRKRNERFYMVGRMLIDLIQESSKKVAKAMADQRMARNSQLAALEQIYQEALSLRKTLLSTYTGERLRQTLNWAMSSVGEDVSGFTSKLTVMECRLFEAGARAASHNMAWKLGATTSDTYRCNSRNAGKYATKRSSVTATPASSSLSSSRHPSRSVTPEQNDDAGRSAGAKRQRVA